MAELQFESPVQRKDTNSRKLVFELVRYYLETINKHWLGSAGIYRCLFPLINTDRSGKVSFDFRLIVPSTQYCIKEVEDEVFTLYKSKYGEIEVNYTSPEIVSFVNDFVRKVKDYVEKESSCIAASFSNLYLSSVEQILSDILGDKKVLKPSSSDTSIAASEIIATKNNTDNETINPFDIDEYVTIVKNSCEKCLDILNIAHSKFNLTGFELEPSKSNYKFIYVSFEFITGDGYQDVEIQIPYNYRNNIFFIKGVFYSTVLHIFDKGTGE